MGAAGVNPSHQCPPTPHGRTAGFVSASEAVPQLRGLSSVAQSGAVHYLLVSSLLPILISAQLLGTRR